MNKLSSQDRSALIRLASTLPVGDQNRKVILAGLSRRAKVSGLSLGRTQLLDERGSPVGRGGIDRHEGSDVVVVAVVHGDYNGQGFTLKWTYEFDSDHDIADGWSYTVNLPNPKKQTLEVSAGPLSADDIEGVLINAGWDALSEELHNLIDYTFNTGKRSNARVFIEL